MFSATSCAGLFNVVEPVTLVSPNESRLGARAQVTAVCGNYFETLGVEAIIGRTFVDGEDRSLPVAVVSHRFWTRELASDAAVIRSRLVHKGVSYQILGVTPTRFTGISSQDDIDVWVPRSMARSAFGADPRVLEGPWLYVFGRLKPGASVRGASADLARNERPAEESPSREIERDRHPRLVSMAKGIQMLRVRFEKPLLVLLGVVGLLLLIACCNLAALMMARAAARRHEIAMRLSLRFARTAGAAVFHGRSLAWHALYGITSYAVHRRTSEIGVRIALGASADDVRWMVLREVLILAATGVATGLPAAMALSTLVHGLLFGLAPVDPFTIAASAFVLVLIVLTAGYLPARRASRVDPMEALRYE